MNIPSGTLNLHNLEHLLLIISLLIFLAIFASDLSKRLKVPAALLFLFTGMLAGSDGLGGIYFDNAELAQSIGIIALSFTLFSGGLDTRWSLVKPILSAGISLSTIGVLTSALLVGSFSYFFLNFSLIEGFLLGAIVSVTDAAAVFSLFRTQRVKVKPELRTLIEFESGSNDPIAILLVLMILQVIKSPDLTLVSLLWGFLFQVVGGVAMGLLIGKAAVWVLSHLKLEYNGLYPVFTLSLVIFTYGATSGIGGSGFLATYLLGMVLHQHDFHHKQNIIQFHDALLWLMEIIMFLVLGLLAFPSQLTEVFDWDLALPLFLIFVARPLSVCIALAFSTYTMKEKILISWVGMRGAVPIVLATFPLVMGIPKAQSIFNLVFFVVLSSFLIQGSLAHRFIKWLKV
jgi:potassium/hydrogen antiporter